MTSISGNRWIVVLASIIILMCLGVAYSWGVFMVPIDHDLGWGRTSLSVAVSVLLFVFSVFMSIGGLCEKKYGPRMTASLGGLCVGAGWIAASWAASPLWLYVSYGAVAGIGTGLSYMPAISSGIKWFPEKKGLITGLIVFGFGFGTAFLSPLATHLIGQYGWRTTMMLYGLALGAIIITAAQFLKTPALSASAESQAHDAQARNYRPAQMIKTNTFKIMFVTYFLAMIAGMMTIGHLSAFAMDKHFTAMQAALALTILAVFNGLGRILFGSFSDTVGSRKALVLLFALIGGAMFLLPYANTLLLIYTFAGIIGLCFGGFLAVYPPLTADCFGARDFSVNYGLVFLGYGGGCFLGPLLGGYIYDMTQNYFMAFNLAGLLAFAGAALVFFCLKTGREFESSPSVC